MYIVHQVLFNMFNLSKHTPKYGILGSNLEGGGALHQLLVGGTASSQNL